MSRPRGSDEGLGSGYGPAAGSYFEHPGRYASAAEDRRSHKPVEVTVHLRRCAEPLQRARHLWVIGFRKLRVTPLELEFAQRLPDVCSDHGRPAVSHRDTLIVFYDTDGHPRHPTPSRDLPRKPPAASTVVVGDWPECDRCIKRRRRHQGVTYFLTAVMVANFVGMLCVSALDYAPLTTALAVGVFPGTIPIGLLTALTISKRGDRRIQARPIDDERFLRLGAHPNFRDALRFIPAPPPPSGAHAPRFRIENGRVVPDRPHGSRLRH